MNTRKVLICSNPDLNFIDGSSVWLQTIALIMASCKDTTVHVLHKSKPERMELIEPLLKQTNISLIDASHRCFHPELKSSKRASFEQMASAAIYLNERQNYDVVIVRGTELASLLIKKTELLKKVWLYLTDIPQKVELMDTEQMQLLKKLGKTANKLLCQSDGFVALWRELLPELAESKIKMYSPVIPDFPQKVPTIAQRKKRAVYAGKFKNDWNTLEMAMEWKNVHKKLPYAQLVMIGDKIHDEKDLPDYKGKMQDALKHTDGLQWLGALSRNAVFEQLLQARVGLSWRDEAMNDTVEYSTKILEYGAAGCAAILNRNSLHEQLLGTDYPLFANNQQEFSHQLKFALRNEEVCVTAANKLRSLANEHTFSKRVQKVASWLRHLPKQINDRKTRVLVAGHDLKFFTLLQLQLEKTGQFEFLIDQWQGHNKHDEEQSLRLLKQADVIFCEWCLGNLEWYSKHKLGHQKLVARFHLQEKDVPYLSNANWNAIDHIAYVSDFIKREGQKAHKFPESKVSVIPNLLDENKFTLKKKMGDARYTLGIIGVTPARKRLDLAVDLLEKLLETDPRYCLRVKGKHPLDYSWILNRPDELQYYADIFKRINENPKLRHRVIFDPAGDDINEWFTLVGFILSPSDFESFHMAIGEGMLTGTVPVIWNWDGAAEIWPNEYITDGSSPELAIFNHNSDSGEQIRGAVAIKYSSSVVVKEWMNIL